MASVPKYAPVNNSHPLHCQQWQSVDKHVEKVELMGTLGNCFEVKKQCFIVKRKQAASFKSLVEGCDGKSVVLQVKCYHSKPKGNSICSLESQPGYTLHCTCMDRNEA